MVTLAAGMESDFSDTECDIVFSTGKPSTSSDKLCEDNDYVPILSNKQNGIISNSLSNDKTECKPSVPSRPTAPSRFRSNHRSHNQHMRRRCVDFPSSQLLDDLRYAILQGNLEIIKDILAKDIWVDTILKSGWTGLMYACSAGHSEIVSCFLEKKADPNYHKDMFTPLMAVCISKKNEDDLLKCCLLLIQYGAKVNAHERHFTTPIMFAAREGHLQIVKTLIEHGASLNLQDNKGNTALAWAATCGHGQIIRLLVEKGADVNIVNSMGQSAVDLAYDHGHNEVASLLQKGHIISDDANIKTSDFPAVTDNDVATHISRTACLSRKSKKFVTLGELEIFLTGIDCRDLIPIFQEHQLKLNDLLIMDDGDLEKIGITQVGVRKKILEACKAAHKKEWEKTSLPNLKKNCYISCADAVSMMANIAKHLNYITSTVIYVRQQIQTQPRILELAQDTSNVHNLIDEMEDSLKNIRFLNDEMRFLKLHLEKVQDQVQCIPADFIVQTVPHEATHGKLIHCVIGITAASAIIVGILWKQPNIVHNIQSSIQFRLPFLSS